MLKKTQAEQNNSIKRNLIMNVLVTLSGVVNPLIVLPYVSRVLHPAGTGRVYFASSVISVFMLLAQMGIPVYGIRACARVRDDRKVLSGTASSIMGLQILFSAGSFVLLTMTAFTIPMLRSEKTLLILMGLGVLLNGINSDWLFQGLEEYPFLTGRAVFFKLASAGAIILLTRNPGDYIIYGPLTMVPAAAASVYNLFFLKKHVDLRLTGPGESFRHLGPAIHFFLLTAMTTVYTNLDMLMLGSIGGAAEAGYYGTAVKIKLGLVNLMIAGVSVLMPRASYLAESGEMNAFRRTITRAISTCLIISSGVSVLFALFAEDSILLLAGRDFERAVLPMTLIMFTLIPIGLSQILGMEVLIPLGREKQVIMGAAAGAAVDVVMNLFLIPAMGAAGAAISTLVSEVIVLIVIVSGVKKECSFLEGIPAGPLLLVILSGLLPGSAAGLLCHAAFASLVSTSHLMLFLAETALFLLIYGGISYFAYTKFLRKKL